ncbi:MAG: serpin family protein [Oscillospiraceae bacterium]|nr:serpin family protein [Oscillospiraceae bacterium]
MKTRISLVIISLLLVCAMAVNLTGCTMEVQAKDLMEGITPNQVNALDDLSSQNADVTDFAIRLFKASEESGKNTLISPLSVLCALAMTANGAEEETLAQMGEVLGMTTEELNLYLYSYMQNLPQGEKYKLSLANSIWFTEDERFTVNQDFLQTNADYYGADIYKAPFDKQTLKDINNWVKQNTDEMIPEILDKIPDEAIMYLVNALAFEAEWMEIYEKQQVRDGKFTKEDRTKQDVEFMYGTEGTYLEDENAIGFKKYYKGGKYAFVAMLPNEGVSVSEYIASLNGESLNALLSNPQYGTVYTSIPKFETEYTVEMAEILKGMGMTEAFDMYNADFEGLGTSTAGNIYISRVLHKTFISVGEKGTKAGAATVVEMADGAAAEPQEPKEVYLDRPFVYMLIDCENNIPFFIGTMMDVN